MAVRHHLERNVSEAGIQQLTANLVRPIRGKQGVVEVRPQHVGLAGGMLVDELSRIVATCGTEEIHDED